jgi:hypothetical protein
VDRNHYSISLVNDAVDVYGYDLQTPPPNVFPQLPDVGRLDAPRDLRGVGLGVREVRITWREVDNADWYEIGYSYNDVEIETPEPDDETGTTEPDDESGTPEPDDETGTTDDGIDDPDESGTTEPDYAPVADKAVWSSWGTATVNVFTHTAPASTIYVRVRAATERLVSAYSICKITMDLFPPPPPFPVLIDEYMDGVATINWPVVKYDPDDPDSQSVTEYMVELASTQG